MAALFTPLRVGSITLPNRVGMSALTRDRALAGVPNELMVEYYAQRATGGAGIIVSEGTLVSRHGGVSLTPWAHVPGLYNKDQVAGWKKVTDAVHAAGSPIYAQLAHVGRLSHPDDPEQKLADVPVYGPSAVPARGGKFRHIPGQPGYVTPTAIPDPWVLVSQFKQAAINAKEAGFDGVEAHAANGLLIHQFLDSIANVRTDQWGGSAENRSRFGLEVLKALKDVFGSNVSLKVSPGGNGETGIGMPLQDTLDTFQYFLKEVDKLQLSYIVLVRYLPHRDVEYDGKKRGIPHDVLETYRPLIKSAKLFLNGAVSPEEGAVLIEAGKVDGVFMGVSWIAHPDLVKRVQNKKALDNMPDVASFYWMDAKKDMTIGYTDYPTAVC